MLDLTRYKNSLIAIKFLLKATKSRQKPNKNCVGMVYC